MGKMEVKPKDQSRKTCFNCGKMEHLVRDPCCLAKGRKCAKCLKYGILLPAANTTAVWQLRKGERPIERKCVTTKSIQEDRQIMLKIIWRASCGKEYPAFAFVVTEDN